MKTVQEMAFSFNKNILASHTGGQLSSDGGLIGAKLDYNEIKKNVNEKEAVGRPIPPTNYTIFTKEDLFKYLDAVGSADHCRL